LLELAGENREQIIKEVQEAGRKLGLTFGEMLGKLIFENTDKRNQLAAMRMYVADVLPKVSEREVNVTETTKPQVFTPEKYPDSSDAPEYRPTH
jgi:hypothetical protein